MQSAGLWTALALVGILSACGDGSSVGTAMPQPGALDASFGSGGVVIASEGGSSGDDIALQSDGKIIVAAAESVIRYNGDGTLDRSFGTGGLASGKLATGTFVASSVALQNDRKILAGGGFTPLGVISFVQWAIVRYLPDGELDLGFGANGIVLSTGAGAPTGVAHIVVQPDAKILAGIFDGSPPALGGGAVRLNADGSFDFSFGSGGVISSSATRTIALQSDGKILVLGGDRHGLSGVTVTRFDTSGSIDPAFGDGGTVVWSVPRVPVAPAAMVLQPDGRIVALNHGAVGRLMPDGAFDMSFGSGGVVTGTAGFALAVQPNGKIIVAGGADGTEPPKGFALWRFNPDGTPDTGFGNEGTVVTQLLDIGSAQAVAIQPDGRVLVSGWAESAPAELSRLHLALARYFGD